MGDEDYSRPLLSLNNSTIGQHVRHTLEFFICMMEGIEKGVVNYDSRQRDPRIETDPQVALTKIDEIMNFLSLLKSLKIMLIIMKQA